MIIGAVMTTSTRKKKIKYEMDAYIDGINELLREIKNSEISYIQCILPNKEKSKLIYDAKFIEKQLKCHGTVQVLINIKTGYSIKIGIKEIYKNIKKKIPVEFTMNKEKKRTFIKGILMEFGLEESMHYLMNEHNVLFRYYANETVEKIMNSGVESLTKEANERIVDAVTTLCSL